MTPLADWLSVQAAEWGRWLLESVLDRSAVLQVALSLLTLLTARLLVPRLRALMGKAVGRPAWMVGGRLELAWRALRLLALPAMWLTGQWAVTLLLTAGQQPHRLAQTVSSLLTAWLVIRLSTVFLADRGWARLVATVAWSIAALDIVGLLDATLRVLDSVGVDFGGTKVTPLLIVKAGLALSLLLWLSGVLSRLLEKRIQALPNVTPSAQVLFTKLTKVTLVTLGSVVALKAAGIDLSAFALLSGAVGVGVGFGLQKVVSNLISGLILLLDKSIKPGDVISLGDTYGWIASLGARYVSVVTRDGIEHLIPNEELITQRVQNWSHSNSRVRLKIPVGVAYGADLPHAMQLCVEAAHAVPRILAEPPPACLMTGFGASSLDLELRCWIDDPRNGVANIRSLVLLGIWERFRAAGIEIPYPQTDVHIRSLPESCAAGRSVAGASHLECSGER